MNFDFVCNYFDKNNWVDIQLELKEYKKSSFQNFSNELFRLCSGSFPKLKLPPVELRQFY